MIRASELFATRLCPGRVEAQRGIPQALASQEATEGTLIHDAHHDPAKAASLNTDQLQVLESQVRARDDLAARVFAGVDIASLRVIREEDFYISVAGRPIISGHPDYVAIGAVDGRTIALVVDFKTGWLSDEVPEPEVNDQLRAYAVMVAMAWNVEEDYVSIIPRFGAAKDAAMYDRLALQLALEDLIGVEQMAREKKDVRVPSPDACKYCLAHGTTRCPETLRAMDIVASHVLLPAQLLPEDIALWIDKAELSIKTATKYLENAKKFIAENPGVVPGYALVPGQSKRSIPDAGAAFNAIAELGITGEEFSQIAKVGVGDVEKLIVKKLRAVNPKMLVKEAEPRAKDIMRAFVVMKQDQPSLKRVQPELAAA